MNKTIPVFVWLAALGGVTVLFIQQGSRVDFNGLVIGQEQAITVAENGYIKALPVRLYEEVKKGDTLAVVQISTIGNDMYDTTLIDARRATAQAELERLKAELKAAEAQLEAEQIDRQRDIFDIQRRLAVDVERARISILEAKTELEPNRALLKDLELEVQIAEDLYKDNAIESYEVQKIKSQCEVTRKTVESYQQLLAQAEADYAQAQLRMDEFMQSAALPSAIAKILDPLAKAITV